MADNLPPIETIRAAVQKHHGGWDKAPDAAVLQLWRSLDDKTRARYLAPAEEPAAEKPAEKGIVK